MHSYRQGSRPLTGRMMVTLGASAPRPEDTEGRARREKRLNLWTEAISHLLAGAEAGEEGLHGADADGLDKDDDRGPDEADRGRKLDEIGHLHVLGSTYNHYSFTGGGQRSPARRDGLLGHYKAYEGGRDGV